MDTLYHTTTTTTVTRNPYLPAIGRVWEVLRAQWRGVPFAIGHRALASAAGCSAGRIPAIMRQLEADGHVRRIPHGLGYLIAICAPDDQRIDRPPASVPAPCLTQRTAAAVADQRIDRPPASAPAPAAPALPQRAAAAGADHGLDRLPPAALSDHGLDRAARKAEAPIGAAWSAASQPDQRADRAAGRMDDHDSHDQHQRQQGARVLDSAAGERLYAALLAAGAQPGVAAAIVRACPERTPERLAFALAAARRRGSLPCPPEALVFGLWRRGEYLIEERDYGRGSGDSGDRRGDGPALGAGGADRPGAAGGAAGGRSRGAGARPRSRLAELVITEADLPAWLREFRAAQRAADAAPV